MPTEDSISDPLIAPLCACGCGSPSPIITKTSKRNGWVKGQYAKFIQHHDHLINGKSQLDWVIDAIKAHGDSDECLEWKFAVNKDGYGRICYERTPVPVHRLAYKLVNGDWPRPCARHTCDNPPCFNPKHVIPGTHYQNMQDMIDRKRYAVGERASKAVLTEEQVRDIRAEYSWNKVTMKMLGEKYGVDPTAIFDIIHRRSWGHLK